jgi:hypothetical protein
VAADRKLHQQGEDTPWSVNVPDHPRRTSSRGYLAAKARTATLAASADPPPYGPPPFHDHHGGGLWLKDADGWFLVRNLAGVEWSAQFCADPALVDRLRRNARRLYAAFPAAVEELGIRGLLDTPITDAAGVARWTDSICNASVPLPADHHTGVLPHGAGVHHYPTPITDIELFKYADFDLWVLDAEGQPAAVTPVDVRGSGDGRVEVQFATPGTTLAAELDAGDAGAAGAGAAAVAAAGRIRAADDPLARQAFARQTGLPAPRPGEQPSAQSRRSSVRASPTVTTEPVTSTPAPP